MPERTEDSQIAKILADVYERDGEGGAKALEAAITEHPDIAEDLRAHAEMLKLVAKAFQDPEDGEAHLPEEIGGYQISDVLGRGGMATVYRARQEQPLRREVAVKVLHQRITDLPALARFDLERESLALMDHANIARILDAGVASDGTPYVAVELVEGVPITEYCTTNHLGLEARLRLMATVCEALQHAHQKGVIHRDIKPSNVLVTEVEGKPVAKVIDFGLAKAIRGSGGDPSLTVAGQVLGTPAYMSPEQASGGDVDTRTDVYGLGMLLYELLVGDVAWDRASCSRENFVQFVRRLADEEPPRPSQRHSSLHGEASGDVTPRAWERRLRGELDWIVLKALAKERERRYATPQALSADIHRYLDHEPVEAGPPSTSYRMRKFVQRHRAGVLSASIATLTLVAASWITFGLYQDATRSGQEAREAEHKAETARGSAEALVDFMLVDLYAGLAPMAKLEILESVAERALEHYEAVGPSEATPVQPGRVRALVRLGEILSQRGDYDRARRSYRHALDLAGQLPAPLGDRAAVEAFKGLAWTSRQLGQLKASEDELASALESIGRLLEASPDDAVFRRARIQVRLDLATVKERLGDSSGALAIHAESLTELNELPQDEDTQSTEASTRLRLGHLLLSLDKTREASTHFSEALAIATAQQPEVQEGVGWRAIRAQAHAGLAGAVSPNDVDHAKRAAALYEENHDADPENANHTWAAADAHRVVAGALRHGGKFTEALTHALKSASMLERLTEQHPDNLGYWRSLGRAHYAAATSCAGSSKRESALQQLNLTIAAYRKAGAPSSELTLSMDLASAHRVKADTLRGGRQWNAAAEQCAAARRILDELRAHGHPSAATDPTRVRVEMTLGDIRYESGDAEGALAVLNVALERVPEKPSVDWVDLASYIHKRLVGPSYMTGRFSKALEHARQHFQLSQENKGWARAAPHRRDLNKRNRQKNQETIYHLELLAGARTAESARDHLLLARSYGVLRRFTQALAAYEQALEDPELRRDRVKGNVYNAACCAALALATVTDEAERARLRGQALALLDENLRAVRAALAKAALPASGVEGKKAAAKLQRHLAWARTGDPDLAPLRDTAEFKALFNEVPPAKGSDEAPPAGTGSKK